MAWLGRPPKNWRAQDRDQLPCSFSFSLNQPAEQQIISLGLGREANPGLLGARARLCLDPLLTHVVPLYSHGHKLGTAQNDLPRGSQPVGLSQTQVGVLGWGWGGVQAAPTHDSFF